MAAAPWRRCRQASREAVPCARELGAELCNLFFQGICAKRTLPRSRRLRCPPCLTVRKRLEGPPTPRGPRVAAAAAAGASRTRPLALDSGDPFGGQTVNGTNERRRMPPWRQQRQRARAQNGRRGRDRAGVCGGRAVLGDRRFCLRQLLLQRRLSGSAVRARGVELGDALTLDVVFRRLQPARHVVFRRGTVRAGQPPSAGSWPGPAGRGAVPRARAFHGTRSALRAGALPPRVPAAVRRWPPPWHRLWRTRRPRPHRLPGGRVGLVTPQLGHSRGGGGRRRTGRFAGSRLTR